MVNIEDFMGTRSIKTSSCLITIINSSTLQITGHSSSHHCLRVWKCILTVHNNISFMLIFYTATKIKSTFFPCIFMYDDFYYLYGKSSCYAGPPDLNSKWYGPKYSGSQIPPSVRERVRYTLSDFWGLQDAVCHVTGKLSCRLRSHASSTTTVWYHNKLHGMNRIGLTEIGIEPKTSLNVH